MTPTQNIHSLRDHSFGRDLPAQNAFVLDEWNVFDDAQKLETPNAWDSINANIGIAEGLERISKVGFTNGLGVRL